MTSHRQGTTRSAAHSAASVVGGERQQTLLLEALQRAEGRVVSYAELRRQGVELPASVVCELELAGVPLQRTVAETAGRRVVGVRLAAAPSADSTHWTDVRFYRASSARAARDRVMSLPWLAGDESPPPLTSPRRARIGRRVLAPAVLVLAAIALAALLAGALPGSAPRPDADGTHRLTSDSAHPHRHILASHSPSPVDRLTGAAAHRTPPVRPTQPAHTAQSPSPNAPVRSSSTPTQAPVSPALAGQLETQGHDLLMTGQASAAVPVLERAVAATGESSGACLQPASSLCFTYAFALYDLGRALALSGQPSAAIPVLTRRLEIDNQRPVVAAELALARQQAG